MTNIQNLDLIISELPEGVKPKVTVLRNSTKYKKSLFGVKSRVSGKNRKGQVAHGVGTMDNNMVMNGRQVMHNI
jgi:hypothetical protein